MSRRGDGEQQEAEREVTSLGALRRGGDGARGADGTIGARSTRSAARSGTTTRSRLGARSRVVVSAQTEPAR